jgi:hypothetical protein
MKNHVGIHADDYNDDFLLPDEESDADLRTRLRGAEKHIQKLEETVGNLQMSRADHNFFVEGQATRITRLEEVVAYLEKDMARLNAELLEVRMGDYIEKEIRYRDRKGTEESLLAGLHT